MTIETFLTKPYWIIDILPKQVPEGSAGQYFAIEKHLLTPPRIDEIYHKFAGVLLALNCYHDITIQDEDEWIKNPEPGTIERLVLERKSINIVIDSDQAMISITGDDHYMTLYGANEDLLELTSAVASAQGLHVWKPEKAKQ